MPVMYFSWAPVYFSQEKVAFFVLQEIAKLLMICFKAGDAELLSLLQLSPMILFCRDNVRIMFVIMTVLQEIEKKYRKTE